MIHRPFCAPKMLVAAALLALPLTGCEIALVVAAAADDDGDYPDEYYETYCNEYVDGTSWQSGKSEKAQLFMSTFNGVPSAAPGSVLAAHDVFPFFIDTDSDPDVDFRIEASGRLERVDDSVGACSTYENTAAAFIEVQTGDAGSGSLVVFIDGDEYDRFDFEVANVEELSLSWDSTISAARAQLLDGEGRAVSAFNAITWEVAPTAVISATTGPVSPQIAWDGSTNEVVVFAFFGDLSEQITLVADPSTGVMTPKQ